MPKRLGIGSGPLIKAHGTRRRAKGYANIAEFLESEKNMTDNDHNDHIFNRLKPMTVVDLLVYKAERLEEKDDIRRSRILDVIPPHVIIEQPEPKLLSKRIGDIIDVTYLHKGKDEVQKRARVKMKLVDIGRCQLKELVTEALFFTPSSDVSHGTLRRHYRVEIPHGEKIVAKISNPDREHIGLLPAYKVTDLSLQGLKFVCSRTARHKGELVPDPIAKLSKNDVIIVRLFIDNMEILWTKAVIRIKIVPDNKQSNVTHFGVEFLEALTFDNNTNTVRFEPYAEKHKNTLLPHITKLQRKLLRRQSEL